MSKEWKHKTYFYKTKVALAVYLVLGLRYGTEEDSGYLNGFTGG